MNLIAFLELEEHKDEHCSLVLWYYLKDTESEFSRGYYSLMGIVYLKPTDPITERIMNLVDEESKTMWDPSIGTATSMFWTLQFVISKYQKYKLKTS